MPRDKIKKTYYIDETKEFYYEGLNLVRYDMHNMPIDMVVINKFFIHYNKKTKEPYICVNVNSLEYKTKNFTYNTKDIGTLLRKE